MKNFASVLTGFVLALTVSVGVYAAEDSSPWAKESIDKAISEGIVPDTLQSDYTSNITRKEFCRLAVQTYIKKTGYTIQEYLQTPFTDIDDDYVTTAYMLEIVSGKGNEKFDPDSAITRQEAAVMLNNLAEVSGVDNNKTNTEKFVDEDHFANWAKDAIYKISAVKNGGTAVMSGTGSGKFSPWMNYTREQAIATMYRLYECSSIPILIPQKDKNIYCVLYDYTTNTDRIYRIDTANNTVKALTDDKSEKSFTDIFAISGDKIYYIAELGLHKNHMYSINTDGTDKTALTPEARQICIGHKYIYYVPTDKRNIVVRTDLNGEDPITTDFSEIYGKDKTYCYIKADKNDKVYIYVESAGGEYPSYGEFGDEPCLYEYDYSTGKALQVPLDTDTDKLASNALSNGKYKYYAHKNIISHFRNMGDDELRRCNIDGTDDRLISDASWSNGDFISSSNTEDVDLYQNKLYFAKPDDRSLFCIFELSSDGSIQKFYPYNEDEESKYDLYSSKFLGIRDNKIYCLCTDVYRKQTILSYNIVTLEKTEVPIS